MRKIVKCPGCKQRIDPQYCHCGMAEEDHTTGTGHQFVPAGCTCGYEDDEPRNCGCSDFESCLDKPNCRRPTGIPPGYSKTVRERIDTERPKYSDAVKSIAAFCDKNAMTKSCFEVLVSKLDDAVAEAVVRGRELRRVRKL